MEKTILQIIIIFFVSFFSCTSQDSGNLFIIGGGKRPPSLVNELIKTANIEKDDFIVVLPMSSSEADTSFFYAKKQFKEQGFNNVVNFDFKKGNISETWIDSLKKSKLIYITGGDQNKFMNIVLNTKIYSAIHIAYKKGATIAGTSAGAAVMSKKKKNDYRKRI
jgi:cyanophycinase